MEPKGNLDLYNHATELCKLAWKKSSWNGEKYKKKLGFLLQGHFGKDVWTLKDLDDEQLLVILKKAHDRLPP
jgi:hypothetical protein